MLAHPSGLGNLLLISVEQGRITEIELILDRVAFAPVGIALKERQV